MVASRRDIRRAALAAAVVLGAAGCTSADGEAAPADSVGIRVVNVEVAPAALTAFTDVIRITGEAEAMHDITLSADESGRVERFAVAKGRYVAQGDVIAELNDDVLRAQTAEARAAADLAREQFERQRRLWEDEKIGSEIAYLQARATADGAAARLATLEARLARTKIRAPVAGIFDEKFIEIGELAMPGSRIARVVSVSQVKVTGGVPERFALAVRTGDSARITFDVFPDRTFTGRIRFVGSSVDPRNRTVPIEIVLANPDGAVKPRMIANVQVARARLRDVIVVPQQIVRRIEDGYQVFVVVERDGRLVADARRVTLGPSYQNRVVITSGLQPGDRVITLGSQLVDPGSRVRIVGAAAADTAQGRVP